MDGVRNIVCRKIWICECPGQFGGSEVAVVYLDICALAKVGGKEYVAPAVLVISAISV